MPNKRFISHYLVSLLETGQSLTIRVNQISLRTISPGPKIHKSGLKIENCDRFPSTGCETKPDSEINFTLYQIYR